MKFITLTDQDGQDIFISIDSIVSIGPGSDFQEVIHSTLVFTGGPSNSFREEPVTILQRIECSK